MRRSKKNKPARNGAQISPEELQLKWARIVRSFWEDERSEFPIGVHRQISTVPRTMPDDRLFTELADLARVPAAGIEKLRMGLSYELSFSWGYRKPPTEKRVGSKKQALIQLRRSEGLSRELSAILSNLDQQALNALLKVDWWRRNRVLKEERHREFAQDHPGKEAPPFPPQPNFPESKPYLDSFQKITKELAELLSEAQSLLQTRPPTNPKGRPRRGAFSPILQGTLTEFTLRLLLDVRAAGGRLSVNKNLGEGTLVDALNLLRPHLPPGFIPRTLPMGALDRVRALDRKIALEPSLGLPI
jgi:hypothetical protein